MNDFNPRMIQLVGQCARPSASRILMLAALAGASCGVFTGCANRAPKQPPVALAPLMPITERANGSMISTHTVTISGRMLRFDGKWPEAKGSLAFLADRNALRAGEVRLTKEQADAALATLTRVTLQDVRSTPTVTVGAGEVATIQIGQDLRFPTGWKKAPVSADGWLATNVATQFLGMSLQVFPRMAMDGGIQLNVTAGTTEFLGYIDHGKPTEKTTAVDEFTRVNEPRTDGRLISINMGPHKVPFFEPVFSTHSVKADQRVAPGQTLVLVDEGRSGSANLETRLVFLTATAKPIVTTVAGERR